MTLVELSAVLASSVVLDVVSVELDEVVPEAVVLPGGGPGGGGGGGPSSMPPSSSEDDEALLSRVCKSDAMSLTVTVPDALLELTAVPLAVEVAAVALVDVASTVSLVLEDVPFVDCRPTR